MTQPKPTPKLSPGQFAQQTLAAVEQFHNGGEYREAEFRRLARELGYDENEVAVVFARAAQREREGLATMRARFSGLGARLGAVRPKPSGSTLRRHLPEKAKPAWKIEEAFSRAETQPKEESKPKYTPPKPEAEAEALKRPLDFVQFAGDKPDHDPEPALLSYGAPFDNARAFARRFCWEADALALFAWGEKFWEMSGGAYQRVSEDGLHALIWRFLDASHKTAANQRVRFIPKPLHVNELFTGLKAGLALPAWCEPPMNLDTGECLGSVMMFRNMLVDLRSQEQIKPSPMNWIHHQVRYDWDPTAKAPNWLAFLESIFPGDQEAKDCVEEALGLSLTDDLTFQKGMLLIGKTRGGKGTILEVLTGLVGDDALISLEFGKWVAGEFGLQGTIGKKVLAFPDVRLKRPQWYGRTLDPGGLDHKSISELLKITAGDRMSIPRKNIGIPWEGKLPGTVWIASNKMLLQRPYPPNTVHQD
jgi:hypothetical protein